VKVRGGGLLEVKAYRGSAGILEMAGRARGHLQAWHKWPLPARPFSGAPARWQPVHKRRHIARFAWSGGQMAARAHESGPEPGCAVELTEIRTRGRHWWSLGFEATGPAGLLGRELRAAARHVFAQALPGEVQPDLEHSISYPQWLSGQKAMGRPA
jgi:hypothetical protein